MRWNNPKRPLLFWLFDGWDPQDDSGEKRPTRDSGRSSRQAAVVDGALPSTAPAAVGVCPISPILSRNQDRPFPARLPGLQGPTTAVPSEPYEVRTMAEAGSEGKETARRKKKVLLVASRYALLGRLLLPGRRWRTRPDAGGYQADAVGCLELRRSTTDDRSLSSGFVRLLRVLGVRSLAQGVTDVEFRCETW